MWEIHYSREAAQYLEDNTSLITELYFAIEALAASSGMPPAGSFDEMQGLILWNTLGHLVILRRTQVAQVVRVLAIKPI
jgi:hypothetical protein